MRVQSGGLGGTSSLREEAEPPPGVRLLALSRCRKPSPLPPCRQQDVARDMKVSEGRWVRQITMGATSQRLTLHFA